MPASNPEIALRKRLDQGVRGFMLSRDLWPVDGPLLLAVSGGSDSTALLLILARLAKNRAASLHVAYFDHALRAPEASEREAAFVRDLCDSLKLSFSTGRGDVAARARHDRTSTEDAARRERYDFLARTARAIGSSHIATGHTASDQAETVLLHIVRGTGLDGLSGMAPSSAWPVAGGGGLTLIRPLLNLTRAETQAYCTVAGVEPMQDESNASPDYTRNRVRNELLPLLRTFNPRVEDALVRLADASREQAVSTPIRAALTAAAGDTQGFSALNAEAIARLLRFGTTGDSIALPRTLRARRTRDALVVEHAITSLPLPDEPVLLEPGCEVVYGHLRVAAHYEAPEERTHVAEVDTAVLAGLRVRRRRPGDRLQPLGMTGTKKLQDLFVDAHVPREERDRIPIFESERGLVWVGGLRIAEWARPQPRRPTVWLSYREAT